MTRPGLTVGAAIMVAAAVGTVAWLMLPPEISSSQQLFEAEGKPPPADAITVTDPVSPPEITRGDFVLANAPSAAAEATTKDKDASSLDWSALAIDEVRERANADDVPAMEE